MALGIFNAKFTLTSAVPSGDNFLVTADIFDGAGSFSGLDATTGDLVFIDISNNIVDNAYVARYKVDSTVSLGIYDATVILRYLDGGTAPDLNNYTSQPGFICRSSPNLDLGWISSSSLQTLPEYLSTYAENINARQQIDASSGGGIQFGNELPMGLPPDGTFSDGIFPWDASTMVTTGLDDVNEILLAIAPTPPGALTGLTLTGTTKYSAILPTGLNSDWYQDGSVAGSTIANYIVDNTYSLSSADPTTAFKVGSTFGGDEGTIYHVLDGTNSSFRDATSGVGTTGTLTISDMTTYNTIWRKANARVDYTQSSEGLVRHAMRYQTLTVNQLTANSKFWYDDVNGVPAFPVDATITQNTLSSSRYLSGVRYYYTGDTFDMTSSITNMAKKAIRPTNPVSYVMSGLTAVNVAIPGGSFAYDGTYNFSQTAVALNSANAYNINARLTITATKPSGTSTAEVTPTENRLVNTYPATYSTNGDITMFDEEYRYLSSHDFSLVPGNYSDPTGDWSSATALSNGNGQLYNSTWYYPSINYSSGYLPSQAANYSAFTGSQEIYWAANIGVAHSSMRIVFTGINYTDIAGDASGNLNLFVRLPTVTGWLDGGRPFGDGTGCQLGSSSGTTLNMTFGTSSSSDSTGVVFIKVRLRNASAAVASRMVITGT